MSTNLILDLWYLFLSNNVQIVELNKNWEVKFKWANDELF